MNFFIDFILRYLYISHKQTKISGNLILPKRINIANYVDVTFCLSFFQTGEGIVALNLTGTRFFLITHSETKFTIRNLLKTEIHEVESRTPNWDNFCFTAKQENMSLLEIRLNNQLLDSKLLIPNSDELIVSITGTTKLAMVNIYGESLEERTPACGKSGDIYSWNTNDWTFDNSAQINEVPIPEVCDNTMLFKHPVERSLPEATKECKRLDAVMPLFEELEENNVYSYFGLGNSYGDGLLLPVLRTENGRYRNIFDQSIRTFDKSFMEKAALNGGSDEPVILCNEKECNDVSKSDPYNFICKVKSGMIMKVRGLCPNSKIDREYIPLSKSTNDSEVTLVGKNSHIKFNPQNDRWKLYVHYGKTTAESKTNKGSVLLGTHLWTIDNDPICNGSNRFDLQLNINTCKDEEYNCVNGDCVRISERCDGKFDCMDASDEKNCKIIHIGGNYNPNIGDVGLDNVTEVNVTTEILSLLAINDKDGTIRAQLKIQLDWKDSRLDYLNLKDSSVENKLNSKDTESIWKPILHLFDTDINKREQHNSETITVKKNDTDEPSYTDSSILHNEHVYHGGHNTLQLNTWLR